MAIKPFKALHYNIDKIHDFAKVVSPPYDVISDEQQTFFHNLNPYNFTHIDLVKDQADDNKENNRYTRAKKTFEEWIKDKVMIEDAEDSIYFYKQEYKVVGEKHSRLGFISLMEIHDDDESKVHPHENTHAHAVDDRYQLTKTLNSNLSSIFVCYSDIHRKVDKIFNKKVIVETPMLDVTDDDGVRHRLWKMSDPELITDINNSIKDQNLFIADGHHRFQVAKDYRQFCLSRISNSTGKEAFNFVMTYFTNLDSRDLQIFPMHRIVKKMPESIDFLEEFFRIDKVKSKQDLLIILAKAGRNEHAFGFYSKKGIQLLRLKNKMLINQHVKGGSDDYKRLDATILKYFVFDRIGVESDDIIYSKDLNHATDMVDQGTADASFIMNPVKIDQLKAIALNGERMPPKTTYFYPKVLSGLTVYNMDE